MLGPPHRIWREGEGRVDKENIHVKASAFVHMRPQGIFDIIKNDIEITPDHRLYWYYHYKKSSYIVWLVVYAQQVDNISVKELYAVVNERTKKVEKVFYIDK